MRQDGEKMVDITYTDVTITTASNPDCSEGNLSLNSGDNFRLCLDFTISKANQAFQSNVYISDDAVLSADDFKHSMSILQTGVSINIDGSPKAFSDVIGSNIFLLPENLPASSDSSYFVIVESFDLFFGPSRLVGPPNISVSSNEIAFSSTAPAATPDLVANSVTVSDTTLVGKDDVNVSYNISNTGGGAASATEAGIYLSSDSTISTTDTLLGTKISSGSSNPNSTDAESQTVTIPEGLAAGTYYIGVVADHKNQETGEKNENNNASPGVAITINSQKPDLTASDVKVSDTTVTGGDTISVTVDIKNEGAGNSGVFETGIYLSENPSITLGADTLIGGNDNLQLQPGLMFDDLSANVSIPNGLAPGTYYIGVVADDKLAIDEDNESNNFSDFVGAVVPITISDPDMDDNPPGGDAGELGALFNANPSQAKGIAAIYETLVGGIPSQAGFTFLITQNNATNFGAGPGPNFNDENIYINVANALVQGNPAATAMFNALSVGDTLAAKVTSLYQGIIPAASQDADGLAFLIRPEGLAFYTAVALERGITSDNGPAIVAMASLLKIAVDGNIGVGNAVNDFLSAVGTSTAAIPATSSSFIPIETADGTGFDNDDSMINANSALAASVDADATNGSYNYINDRSSGQFFADAHYEYADLIGVSDDGMWVG